MNKISLIAIIIAISSLANYSFQLHKWQKPGSVIAADVIDYYAYLPATFIYKDLTLKYKDTNLDFFASRVYGHKLHNGNYVIKMSMGASMMYLPFFLIANQATSLTGCPQTGYSSVYEFFLVMGTLCYVFVGLWYLRKLLLMYFSDISTAFTLLLITIGTNLFYYSSVESTMTHAYSFCLFSLFLYFTIKWNELPSIKYSLYLGFIAGLITLIRPTNIIVVMIFLLWDISSVNGIKERCLSLIKKWKYLIIMSIVAIAVWIPQFVYWKYVSGNYIFYSYTKEGFFFSDPKIIEVLFSYRKGWLLYTPMMIFSLLGMFFIRKNSKQFTVAIPLFFIVNVYVISSWWCWWYGGSFGMRPLVESYAFLAIPFAAFVQYVFEKNKVYRIAFIAVAGFLIYVNIYQTRQCRICQIHYDSMTKEAYWNVFLSNPRDSRSLIKTPDYEKAILGERD